MNINNIQKFSHCEGRISIPLKENANIGEKIPPCSYSQKTGIINMKASLKGKYLGRDNIHTPSGNYDCIKIYTESKGKIMFVSESEYSIDWYAKKCRISKIRNRYKKKEKFYYRLFYMPLNNNRLITQQTNTTIYHSKNKKPYQIIVVYLW